MAAELGISKTPIREALKFAREGDCVDYLEGGLEAALRQFRDGAIFVTVN
jgi:hypothetical protein